MNNLKRLMNDAKKKTAMDPVKEIIYTQNQINIFENNHKTFHDVTN